MKSLRYLVLMLIVSLLAFSVVASAGVTYQNKAIGSGILNVTQFGMYDVGFNNTLRVGSGVLNFKQDIGTYYGNFSNDVRLRGSNLKINNVAGEQFVPGHYQDFVGDGLGPQWVPTHRQVSFSQNVYVHDLDFAIDSMKAKQKFYAMPGYIRQVADIHPLFGGPNTEPDTTNMWSGSKGQFGVMNSSSIQQQAGGRALLQQTGFASADSIMVGQFSNIGGVSGSMDWKNDATPLNWDQIVIYQ